MNVFKNHQRFLESETTKTKMLKNPNYMYGPKLVLVPGHINFSTYILDALWKFKDNVALINAATNESITFGAIGQQAINFAVSLHRIGVRKGDVIGILSENRQEYWSAFIGATSVGAVLTTFSTTYVKGELIHVMNISKPKYIICSPFTYKTHKKTLESFKTIKNIILFGNEVPKNVFSFDELAVKVDKVDYEKFDAVDVDGQIDTLLIVYSSGTTGMPKGVMLTHLNVMTSCCFPPSSANITTLVISPWYHVMGLMSVLRTLPQRRTTVYMPKFDLDVYLKAIETYKIVQLMVVPPVLVAVCKATGQYDLSSVKLIYSGAAPLHKDSLKSVYEKFPNLTHILQGYGASECTLGVTQFYFSELENATENISLTKPASVGKVVPGCVIKIVDIESREPLGPNKQGEICVKGPLLMKGYVGIGRTKEDFDEEGFYKTGDVGYYDGDKYFYIADRLKELIKYKGFQVPPAELEAILLTHKAVKDVGVIGVPHESAGEVPLAFVVPNGDVSEDELKKYVAERLSNPKHLRGGVRFVSAIPKLPSGKILRKELRKMLTAGQSKL